LGFWSVAAAAVMMMMISSAAMSRPATATADCGDKWGVKGREWLVDGAVSGWR